ncbi:MAG: hypothetical protein K6A65_00255 [Succinivibrionaceae bacterium]|nr:hypothetical protein [Succinivibrionaceae bacterium]
MRRRIFAAVLCTSLAVLAAGLFGVLLLTDLIMSQDLEARLAAFAHDLAQGENRAPGWLRGQRFGMFRATIIDPGGTVLYDSFEEAAGMDSHADREEVREALATGSGSSNRYSSSLGTRTLYHALRLGNGTVLRCAVTSDTIFRQVQGIALVALGIALLGAIVSALIARALTDKIVRPINRIDLNHPLESEVYDELSPLLGKISAQQRQIAAQIADIRQRSEEFMVITDRMAEGLIILNPRLEIMSINRSACRILGVGPDCVGRPLLSVDRSALSRELLEGTYSDGQRPLERDGRHYLAIANRISMDGSPKGLAVLLVDITERRLAEMQRMEFTANVSHELKTPLQSVIGSAELLESGLARPGDVQAFAGKIRQQGLRLLSLINDIIFLSRLDEGRHGGEQDFTLRAVAADALDMLRDKARERGVDLGMEVANATVYGAYQYLHTLIFNLMENAIKYGREGGHARLVISAGECDITIAAEDDGIGIPERDQARVFERFYRVDRGPAALIAGTGLGLSIVKRITLLYHGQLELESKEGQGTTMTVRLPRAALSRPA